MLAQRGVGGIGGWGWGWIASYGRADIFYWGQLKLNRRFGGGRELKSSSLRFHFNSNSMSIRFRFDFTSMPIRFHFDVTSISLRPHFDFTMGRWKTPCHTRGKGKPVVATVKTITKLHAAMVFLWWKTFTKLPAAMAFHGETHLPKYMPPWPSMVNKNLPNYL